METRVNYIVVGLFVIILSGLLISGLFWLGVRPPSRNYTLYIVYMTESVSGLTIDSPVKYRGVDVGRVKRIRLRPDDPEQVELLLEIEKNTPIREDTFASLAFQGITGIAHVNLKGEDSAAPPLVRQENEPYPVIKSSPSLLLRLDEGLTRLIHNLSEASESLDELTTGPERQSLANILRHTEKVAGTIAGRSADLDAAIQDAANLFNKGSAAGERFESAFDAIDRASEGVFAMTKEMSKQAELVGEKSVSGIETFETSMRETETILRNLAVDLQALSLALQDLVLDIKQNPDLLLKGRPIVPAGPGE